MTENIYGWVRAFVIATITIIICKVFDMIYNIGDVGLFIIAFILYGYNFAGFIEGCLYTNAKNNMIGKGE